MKKKLIALLIGTSLALAACGGGEDEATDVKDTASSGDGQKLFEQKCSGCHGVNLEGGVGPKLQGTALSQAEIEEVIKNGKGGMPPGLLQGEEATKVAEWIKTQK